MDRKYHIVLLMVLLLVPVGVVNGQQLSKVALEGDIAPNGSVIEEVSGRIFGMVKGFDVNDEGTVVYHAKLAKGGEGIFTSDGDIIALKGKAAPGGGIFKTFVHSGGYKYVSINNSGKVAYLGILDDGTEGVFTQIAAIAKQGQVSPDGGTYERIYGANDINDAGLVVFRARALARQQKDHLYGITFEEELIGLRQDTGQGTLILELETPRANFIGLAGRNGKLYTFDQQRDKIRKLDPTTGSTLNTIDVAIRGDGEGALAFDSKGLGVLCIGAQGGDTSQRSIIYTFDLSTHSSSVFKTLPINFHFDGLAFDKDDVLYGLQQGGRYLHIIDTNTGRTTQIGNTGVSGNVDPFVSGLTFGSDGTLYAAITNDTGGKLYIIDHTTAEAALVGHIGFDDISGLATLSDDPPLVTKIYSSNAVIAESGDPAPGGGYLSYMGGQPILRNNDTVVYLSDFVDESAAGQGVFASDGSNFGRAGDPSPAGGIFATGGGHFNEPDANNVGGAAFLAGLTTGEEGVFTSNRRIAYTGGPAPGGETFADLFGSPSINDTGLVVYSGQRSDGSAGIFDSDNNVIVEAGQPASDDYVIVDLADPVLTDNGQVAFYARVSDGTISREGIFITSPTSGSEP